MFLKFICKAFFAKKHCKNGKKQQNKWPKRYFNAFFPGIVRPFGKTGSHSRESRAALRAQIRRAKTIFYGGRIRWNGTVGIRRGTANKKQKLPHKKRTAPFPERYTWYVPLILGVQKTGYISLVSNLICAVIESIVIHTLVDAHAPQDDAGVIAVLQDHLL